MSEIVLMFSKSKGTSSYCNICSDNAEQIGAA
jgi:hypothetical protein